MLHICCIFIFWKVYLNIFDLPTDVASYLRMTEPHKSFPFYVQYNFFGKDRRRNEYISLINSLIDWYLIEFTFLKFGPKKF